MLGVGGGLHEDGAVVSVREPALDSRTHVRWPQKSQVELLEGTELKSWT